ncbi:MAG: DNA polymerase III subunit gamma/tau [Clostridia bacterium]|nr:DNA polymerase III subunit gamma/tau [Clostridia bacterium]
MYRALYRKWRPLDFDDVCGQEQVTDILKYQVAEKKTSHAYLFCGSRGTGKTSCAKILAKAVNCLDPKNGNPCNACAACRSIDNGTATDVIEMDAASNTGVDNVRDIKDEIVFTPAELRYRVYIIDEVHMMSGSAFNALLKTLEEPPSHVLFILATTELHKLPSTIISRCQRYEFRRLTTDVIMKRLFTIAETEAIELDQSGARVIARTAQGGMRDAVSLLELCAGRKQRIDADLAAETLGLGNRDALFRVVNSILHKDYPTLYGEIADITMSSRDISVFWQELTDFYRDMLIAATVPNAGEYLDLTEVEASALLELSSEFPFERLIYHTRVLEEAQAAMLRPGVSRRTVAELFLTRMCEERLSFSAEALLSRIVKLENEVSRLRVEGTVAIPSQEMSVAKTVDEPAPAVTPKKEAMVAAPAPSAEKPQLRKLSCFREVAEKMIAAKPSLVGALSTATALVDQSGRVLICVENGFYKDLLEREDVRNAILRNITDESDGEIAVTALEIQCADKREEDLLGELLNSVE